jgi:hypothetical protein
MLDTCRMDMLRKDDAIFSPHVSRSRKRTTNSIGIKERVCM